MRRMELPKCNILRKFKVLEADKFDDQCLSDNNKSCLLGLR